MEENTGQLSDSPLHSDFERLGNSLNEAFSLAKENNNYNPATLREYFSILKEIFRFLYPLVRGREGVEQLKKDFELFDKITLEAHLKLLRDKKYLVPHKLFEVLSIFHQELLIIKQDANLGIRVKKNWTAKKLLENTLE